jgi:hypothetical protein
MYLSVTLGKHDDETRHVGRWEGYRAPKAARVEYLRINARQLQPVIPKNHEKIAAIKSPQTAETADH